MRRKIVNSNILSRKTLVCHIAVLAALRGFASSWEELQRPGACLKVVELNCSNALRYSSKIHCNSGIGR